MLHILNRNHWFLGANIFIPSPSIILDYFHFFFQGEILEADERVGRKYIQQLEELRMQLEKEKEMALRKERDIARQRYDRIFFSTR